jgi:hypothetical protein
VCCRINSVPRSSLRLRNRDIRLRLARLPISARHTATLIGGGMGGSRCGRLPLRVGGVGAVCKVLRCESIW